MLNELRPGRVLTEMALAAEYGSSQGAVREALMRIAGEGLVSRSGHQGTVVTDLDATEAAEILGLRRRIEGRGAAAVVRRLAEGDLDPLRAGITAMHDAASADDLWAMVRADTAFHLAIFRIASLQAMQPILSRCILHTHRFRLWAPWHHRKLRATADRHLPILARLDARDAAGLKRELELHLDTIVERENAA